MIQYIILISFMYFSGKFFFLQCIFYYFIVGLQCGGGYEIVVMGLQNEDTLYFGRMCNTHTFWYMVM